MSLLYLELFGAILAGIGIFGTFFRVPVLSYIGAGSLALFAACAVSGWEIRVKADRRRFIGYCLALASACCILHGMAFQDGDGALLDFYFHMDVRFLLMGFMLSGCYVFLRENPKPYYLRGSLLCLCLILPGITCKVHGFYLLTGHVSVFYSIGWCMTALYLWQTAKSGLFGLLCGFLMGPAFLLYMSGSEYGLWTGFLFVLLHACRNLQVYYSAAVIAAWSCFVFGLWFGNIGAEIVSSLCGILLFLAGDTETRLVANRRMWRNGILAVIPACYIMVCVLRMFL